MSYFRVQNRDGWRKLYDYVDFSSKFFMSGQDDLFQYYQHFLDLSEPLFDLSTKECNRIFWQGLHPEDHNTLLPHLIDNYPYQPAGAPFCLHEVFHLARAVLFKCRSFPSQSQDQYNHEYDPWRDNSPQQDYHLRCSAQNYNPRHDYRCDCNSYLDLNYDTQCNANLRHNGNLRRKYSYQHDYSHQYSRDNEMDSVDQSAHQYSRVRDPRVSDSKEYEQPFITHRTRGGRHPEAPAVAHCEEPTHEEDQQTLSPSTPAPAPTLAASPAPVVLTVAAASTTVAQPVVAISSAAATSPTPVAQPAPVTTPAAQLAPAAQIATSAAIAFPRLAYPRRLTFYRRLVASRHLVCLSCLVSSTISPPSIALPALSLPVAAAAFSPSQPTVTVSSAPVSFTAASLACTTTTLIAHSTPAVSSKPTSATLPAATTLSAPAILPAPTVSSTLPAPAPAPSSLATPSPRLPEVTPNDHIVQECLEVSKTSHRATPSTKKPQPPQSQGPRRQPRRCHRHPRRRRQRQQHRTHNPACHCPVHTRALVHTCHRHLIWRRPRRRGKKMTLAPPTAPTPSPLPSSNPTFHSTPPASTPTPQATTPGITALSPQHAEIPSVTISVATPTTPTPAASLLSPSAMETQPSRPHQQQQHQSKANTPTHVVSPFPQQQLHHQQPKRPAITAPPAPPLPTTTDKPPTPKASQHHAHQYTEALNTDSTLASPPTATAIVSNASVTPSSHQHTTLPLTPPDTANQPLPFPPPCDAELDAPCTLPSDPAQLLGTPFSTRQRTCNFFTTND